MAAVDRVSKLPDPILHHILSFLTHKQAIQTSALSKTWRHVGSTRPKIVLYEDWFWKSAVRESSFLSVLGKTLQRYNHQNLSVNEIILGMSPLSPDDHHDQLMDHDLENILSKGLKRLSLVRVQIKAETLEKIVRSCPLIEYLRVSGYTWFTTTIPLTIFQAEFLTELHLSGYYSSRGPNLIVPTDQLLLIKRLKTISLQRVYIAEETLEKIMCGCPLIESLLLTDCKGLTNIQLIKNNNNLKHFSAYFDKVTVKSFEIDAPTIETISFSYCLNWFGHDKYFFPRLKTLYLWMVRLSAGFFESLSSNFPSLEDLQLQRCYGFRKIQLTVSSIKRLVILFHSDQRIVTTIYAPNIHYFKLSAHYPQRLIFNTETASREWKSQVEMLFDEYKDSMLLWLRELSKLLNSLSESQISLKFDYKHFENLKVDQVPNDVVFGKPVPLEDVSVEGYYESCPFPDLLNCLFLICRPRYIFMNWHTTNPVTYNLKSEKDKPVEFITIQNEGEMSCRYLCERDLEEISMHVWDHNSKGWHTVGVEGTCFPGFTTSSPRIRFSVKWRD